MFKVYYHMERFSKVLGHKWVGPCSTEHVEPEYLGEAESYNEALDLAYKHLWTIYPYKDMVKTVIRRGELVAYLKEDPMIEQHYAII